MISYMHIKHKHISTHIHKRAKKKKKKRLSNLLVQMASFTQLQTATRQQRHAYHASNKKTHISELAARFAWHSLERCLTQKHAVSYFTQNHAVTCTFPTGIRLMVLNVNVPWWHALWSQCHTSRLILICQYNGRKLLGKLHLNMKTVCELTICQYFGCSTSSKPASIRKLITRWNNLSHSGGWA